jgi:hypothetical protein
MDAYFPHASLGSLSQINLICASWLMAAERSQSTHNGGYLLASSPSRPITMRDRRWDKGWFQIAEYERLGRRQVRE